MHIVIGLLLAFLLIAIFSNRRTRHCRWRADRSRDEAGRSFYRCMACGHQRFTTDGKPPKHCEKAQSGGPDGTR